MLRTDVLEALLEVSSNINFAMDLKNEIDQYFNILTDVVIQSARLIVTGNLADDEIFVLSVKCLINFSAQKEFSEKLFECLTTQKREEFLSSLAKFYLADGMDETKNLALSILINLTTLSCWSYSFCGTKYLKILLKRATCEIKPSKMGLNLLLNLSTEPEMRCHMFGDIFYFSTIGKMLLELQDVDSRLAVAGIIRNCCFDGSLHKCICAEHGDFLRCAFVALCDANDKFSSEEFNKFPPYIRFAYDSKSVKRESDVFVKTRLCEAFLQLCSSKVGRSHLRSHGVYYILREMHRQECIVEREMVRSNHPDTLLTRKLIFSIEQVVDQLICEEHERPEGCSNLRAVSIDEETVEKLNKAKEAFLEFI